MSEDILYLAYVRGFLESCICQRMFISCICQRIYLFQHILHLRCQRITCILHLRCQRIFFIFTWHLFSLYLLSLRHLFSLRAPFALSFMSSICSIFHELHLLYLPWASFQPLFSLPSAYFQPRFASSSLVSFQSNSSYHN